MRRVIFLALLTLTCLVPHDAEAQAVLPVTPDPADCVADPIDIDRLVEQASSSRVPVSPPSISSPEASASPDLDRWTPSETRAVLEPVFGSIACTNANMPLRALAYFTEDYLLNRISNEPAVTLGHLQAAASRSPDVAAVKDRVTIQSLFAGGMLAGWGFLIVETLHGDTTTVSHLYLADTSSGWRIDDVVLVEE